MACCSYSCLYRVYWMSSCKRIDTFRNDTGESRCSHVHCVDTLLAVLWSGFSRGLGDWQMSSIYWLEKRGKERVTGRCVLGEGGYDRLSNSPQDTSHTSLGGSGKENGRYVCHECTISRKHTHVDTHTHTSIPITPFPSLELTSWVMLTGTPLESGGRESKERNGRKERRGEGEKWWKGESWGSSEGWGERRRENKTERGNRIPQHEAEWSMSPCHLPHTVNGWPPQSCHQRLISAARKWIKGRAERRGGRQKIVEKSFFRRKTHCNLLQFLKTNMTGWNYSATTEAVICKCHKVQV